MGIFSRGPAAAGGAADEALPFLTVSEAGEVRRLVAEAFAERGVEVEVALDRVVDADGREFGLWNVAQNCQHSGRSRRWRSVVEDHVGRVLAALEGPDGFETLSPEGARAATYARLYDADEMPDDDVLRRRPFAPGVVELLALDLPDSVAPYPAEEADRLGGPELLRSWGLENLRRELGDGELVRVDVPGGGRFDVLIDESMFTASRALLLPELVERLTGEQVGEHGWLLAVPNRHQVVWHVVRDLSLVPAVGGMVEFAQLGYDDAGSVSPHVFWWNGDSYEQLTRFEGGEVHVDVSDRLRETMERLAEPGS